MSFNMTTVSGTEANSNQFLARFFISFRLAPTASITVFSMFAFKLFPRMNITYRIYSSERGYMFVCVCVPEVDECVGQRERGDVFV